MNMSRGFLFAFSLMGLAACSPLKPLPDCGRRPDGDTLSAAEKVALADALARYGGRCTGSDRQCTISVRRNKDGGIAVAVGSIIPDRKSGKCRYPIGHQNLAEYNADGQFVQEHLML